jgi:ferredoxin
MTEQILPVVLRRHCKVHFKTNDNCTGCKYHCYEAVTSLFKMDNEQPAFWKEDKMRMIRNIVLEVKLR